MRLSLCIAACPVCYLPVDEAIALMPKSPSPSPVLKNLTFLYEENLNRETEFGGSDFGGYPTLRQRNDSYDIRESMSIHCGYVKDSYFNPDLFNCYLLNLQDLFSKLLPLSAKSSIYVHILTEQVCQRKQTWVRNRI